MNSSITLRRMARISRILAAALLFLLLVGGTGVVIADSESVSSEKTTVSECPGFENTQAYDKIPEDHPVTDEHPGVTNSADARLMALMKCTAAHN